jgi:hypothetical protein
MSPNAGGGEGVAGSQPQPMSIAVHNAHVAQINFGDLKPYLTYCGKGPIDLSREIWRIYSDGKTMSEIEEDPRGYGRDRRVLMWIEVIEVRGTERGINGIGGPRSR